MILEDQKFSFINNHRNSSFASFFTFATYGKYFFYTKSFESWTSANQVELTASLTNRCRLPRVPSASVHSRQIGPIVN